MDYVPHSTEDREKILRAIGVDSLEELFADIPKKFKLRHLLDLPTQLSEQELYGLLSELAKENRIPELTLTGAGAYHHYIPAVVGHITGRAEFYTAYTPYQAEISPGILQAIYEYQTMIASLTGTKVANASMYDGATAMAEAAVLAIKSSGRNRIVVVRSVHPEYRQVLRTYCWANGCDLAEVPYTSSGQTDTGALQAAVGTPTAAVLVQSPNFFGVIEDVEFLSSIAHGSGSLLAAGFTDPTSLGILKPAGQSGADFVVGEGQSFGNALNFGGPYLGIFASTEAFLRKIPGRLSGATVDKEGRRAFTLTLQTREQHIRREKATSNICSNEALCALAAAVYLVCLGKNLKKLAELNARNAHHMQKRLLSLPGWEALFDGPFYNEFALRCPDPAAVNRKLEQNGILGGYILSQDYPELENAMLICATETLRERDIERILSIVE